MELATTHEKEDAFLTEVGMGQLVRVCAIALGGIGILIAGWLWPSYFQYTYWYFSDTFLADVMRFWPAFAWALGMNLLVVIFGDIRSSVYDERLLNRGVIISVGAGVTEEGWYRGVGVFYAMVGLTILNWLFGTMAWLFIVAGGFGLLALAASVPLMWRDLTFAGILGRLFGALGLVAVMYALVTFQHEPMTHLYQKVFYPIISFVSFGLMEPVFTGDHQPLLVMGMISANFAFRDGHKYQGLIGWTNAWWMGCVFIFATLNYGLPVAIAVHAVYDILIMLLVYAGRKVRG